MAEVMADSKQARDQGQCCEHPTAVEENEGGGGEVVDVGAQAVGERQLLLVELRLLFVMSGALTRACIRRGAPEPRLRPHLLLGV